MQDAKPELTALPRRRFLKAVGAGVGLTTAAGLGITIAYQRHVGCPQVGMQDVPVRNPAFLHSTGTTPGHLVVYCQTSATETLAYELNSAAAAIWQACLSHEEFAQGKRRTLAELQSDGLADVQAFTEFLSVMIAKGLIFLANSNTRVYFAFDEHYS